MFDKSWLRRWMIAGAVVSVTALAQGCAHQNAGVGGSGYPEGVPDRATVIQHSKVNAWDSSTRTNLPSRNNDPVLMQREYTTGINAGPSILNPGAGDSHLRAPGGSAYGYGADSRGVAGGFGAEHE